MRNIQPTCSNVSCHGGRTTPDWWRWNGVWERGGVADARGRLRLGLLFGGASVEQEVSVVSARGVLAGLAPERYACVPIGVTGDGEWLAPELSEPVLEGTAVRVDPVPGRIVDRVEGWARLRVRPPPRREVPQR